jgi:hypothetical protein
MKRRGMPPNHSSESSVAGDTFNFRGKCLRWDTTSKAVMGSGEVLNLALLEFKRRVEDCLVVG